MNGSLLVDEDFTMDPAFDDLLWSGEEIQPGMVILIADRVLRSGSSLNTDARAWCTAERVEVTPRGPRQGGPLVTFLAVYADGSKVKRSYATSWSWYVKKDSIA